MTRRGSLVRCGQRPVDESGGALLIDSSLSRSYDTVVVRTFVVSSLKSAVFVVSTQHSRRAQLHSSLHH